MFFGVIGLFQVGVLAAPYSTSPQYCKTAGLIREEPPANFRLGNFFGWHIKKDKETDYREIDRFRRYGEMGLRIAIGEEKRHIYRSLITESLFIGFAGSVVGTAFGLFFASLLTKGIDIGSMMQNSTMMMQGVMKAKITPDAYYIGFIPGIFATTLGTALAGIGIFKRKTAQLFKELEV